MRKRLLYIGVAAAVAVGCTKSIEPNKQVDPVTPPEPEVEMLTISVGSAESGNQSRIAVEENEEGGLTTLWNNESDLLAGWAPNTTEVQMFSIVEGSLSDDRKYATFEGVKPGERARLIHPYSSGIEISNDGKYSIYNYFQMVDLANDGLGALAHQTHMVSELFDTASDTQPYMKHLCAVIKIGMRFEHIQADKNYKISQLFFGGNEGLEVPTSAKVDLNKEVGEQGMLTTESEGAINVVVSNSPVVGNYADNGVTYFVNFSSLPFTITTGSEIKMGVELMAEDGSTTSAVYSITYNGSSDFEVERASYVNLNYMCSVSLVAGGSISDWDTSMDDIVDIPITNNKVEMSISEFLAMTRNNIPEGDEWIITGDATEAELAALTENQYNFTEINGTLFLEKNRTISLEFSDLSVIPESGLADGYAINKLSLPNAVEAKDSAFSRCINLTSVYAPKLKTVGAESFNNCTSLESISLPAAETIDNGGFRACPMLSKVEFPSVNKLGPQVFAECQALKELNLPLLKSIDIGTFGGCFLTSINCAALESIDTSVQPMRSTLESISLASAKSIGGNTFDGFSKLKTVYLPEVTDIGQLAFSYCPELEEISLPKVKNISFRLFALCQKLKKVNIPLAENIGSMAFSECPVLESVSFPNVALVEFRAFASCLGLKSANLPAATEFKGMTFYGCSSLEKADFPLVQTMGSNEFTDCSKLSEVNLPSVTTIGYVTFLGCPLLRTMQLATNSGVVLSNLSDGLFGPRENFDIDLTVGAANSHLVDTEAATITLGETTHTFKSITVLSAE